MSACSLPIGPENGDTKISCQIWMTKCGKIGQMTGKSICREKEESPDLGLRH